MIRKSSHRPSTWKADSGLTKRQVRRMRDSLDRALMRVEMVTRSLSSR
jgi:hypothetical protein